MPAAEVVIPRHAAVAVDRPPLFAVTVERPGGVVVSKRERLALATAVAIWGGAAGPPVRVGSSHPATPGPGTVSDGVRG